MKIAIESNDGITIKSPFLKTEGYLVYDIDESHINSYEYRKAVQRKKAEVSLSKNPRNALNDCSTIISRGMNRIELQSLKEEGKKVFITFKTSAKDAVNLYMKELLISEGIHH
jgi:predicted Fe-Mo cluster-binding NifX family protein